MCFPNWIAPVINLALGKLLHLSNCIYLKQNMGGMAVSQDAKKAMEKHHKEPYSALVYVSHYLRKARDWTLSL